jgi:hypothetical protein
MKLGEFPFRKLKQGVLDVHRRMHTKLKKVAGGPTVLKPWNNRRNTGEDSVQNRGIHSGKLAKIVFKTDHRRV